MKLKNTAIIKKILIFGGVGAIVLVGIFLAGRQRGSSTSSNKTIMSRSDDEVTAVASVNQSFEFGLQNINKKTEIVKFTITSVERKNEIKLKEQLRKPSEGKDYLLVRIEIDNPHTDKLAIASADRIRLLADGERSFAPDYHNGVVILEPISVKRDLVAFVVNKADKSFILQVGDLTGDKQKIEVNF